MASLSVTASVRCQATMLTNSIPVSGRNSTLKLASVCLGRTPLNTHKTSRLRISCAAKPETIEKVCEIVRKQLALAPEMEVTPDTKFSALGADSLDTVEIVMGLEEEFNINVEEDGSENITTVQEAADLIEKIIEKKAAPSAAV